MQTCALSPLVLILSWPLISPCFCPPDSSLCTNLCKRVFPPENPLPPEQSLSCHCCSRAVSGSQERTWQNKHLAKFHRGGPFTLGCHGEWGDGKVRTSCVNQTFVSKTDPHPPAPTRPQEVVRVWKFCCSSLKVNRKISALYHSGYVGWSWHSWIKQTYRMPIGVKLTEVEHGLNQTRKKVSNSSCIFNKQACGASVYAALVHIDH